MGMIKDPTSWRVGFELGLAGFSFPYSKPRRKPTAYLYNGIRLPALPEWDRGVYPYAVIAKSGSLYILLIANKPCFYPAVNNNGYTAVGISEDCKASCGNLFSGDKEWPVPAFLSYTATNGFMRMDCYLWANYNIYNSDGSIYLAASDPVPVYE